MSYHPPIIALSGYARAGKDEAARALTESGAGYRRYAFADQLKRLAYVSDPQLKGLVLSTGWDGAKTRPWVRRRLQDLGLGCRDLLGPDVWVEALERRWVRDGRPPAVITDARFPNEAEWVQKVGGRVWRISRPDTGPVNEHVSERALDGFGFDAFITNDGDIDQLHERVLLTLSVS